VALKVKQDKIKHAKSKNEFAKSKQLNNTKLTVVNAGCRVGGGGYVV